MGGGAEYVRATQAHKLGDAAALPVLDSLHATKRIETQAAGKLGGTAKGVDDICVGVMFVHGHD